MSKRPEDSKYYDEWTNFNKNSPDWSQEGFEKHDSTMAMVKVIGIVAFLVWFIS